MANPTTLKSFSIALLKPLVEEKIRQYRATIASSNGQSPVQQAYLNKKLNEVLEQKQTLLSGTVDTIIHQPLTASVMDATVVTSDELRTIGPKTEYKISLPESQLSLKVDRMTFEVEIGQSAKA